MKSLNKLPGRKQEIHQEVIKKKMIEGLGKRHSWINGVVRKNNLKYGFIKNYSKWCIIHKIENCERVMPNPRWKKYDEAIAFIVFIHSIRSEWNCYKILSHTNLSLSSQRMSNNPSLTSTSIYVTLTAEVRHKF